MDDEQITITVNGEVACITMDQIGETIMRYMRMHESVALLGQCEQSWANECNRFGQLTYINKVGFE